MNRYQTNNWKGKHKEDNTCEKEQINIYIDTNLAIEGNWNSGAWFVHEKSNRIATTTWNQRGYVNPLSAEAKVVQNAVEVANNIKAQDILIHSNN